MNNNNNYSANLYGDDVLKNKYNENINGLYLKRGEDLKIQILKANCNTTYTGKKICNKDVNGDSIVVDNILGYYDLLKHLSSNNLDYILPVDNFDNIFVNLKLKTLEDILESWKEDDNKIQDIIDSIYKNSTVQNKNKYLTLDVLEKNADDDKYSKVEGMQDYVFFDLTSFNQKNTCIVKNETGVGIDVCNEFYNVSSNFILESIKKVDISISKNSPYIIYISWDSSFDSGGVSYDVDYKERGSEKWLTYHESLGSSRFFLTVNQDNISNENGKNLKKNTIYDLRIKSKQDVTLGISDVKKAFSYPFEFEINTSDIGYSFDVPLFVDSNELFQFKIINIDNSQEYVEKIKKEKIWVYFKNNNSDYYEKILFKKPDDLNTSYMSNWLRLKKEGEYSVRLCIGKTKESCNLYGFKKDVIVKNFNCKEVFEGHNDLNKDRINMVFVGSQYSDVKEFLSVVKNSLQWDSKPDPIYNDKGLVSSLLWGFFL